MKNTGKQIVLRFFTALVLLIAFAGCSDVLDNPLKDKESGENINLLVLDFNFFDTRISVKLIDAEDGSIITSPATIDFTGKNSGDIVTFAGDKKTELYTTKGQVEITIDPNTVYSESDPFEFAVHVKVPGYNKLSKGIQLRNKGKKTIELQLSKIADGENKDLNGEMNIENGDTTIVFSNLINSGLKSATTETKPYSVNYTIAYSDFLKLKDTNGNLIFSSSAELNQAYNNNPDNFFSMSINTYSNYDPAIDVINDNGVAVSALMQKLETGTLTQLKINGIIAGDLNGGSISSTCSYTGGDVPDIFGFAEFGEESWNVTGTENSYTKLNFEYTIVKASKEPLCETGCSITFSSGVKSSFSIDADVYDTDNNLVTTINFKGTFPETFVIENTPQKAVKVVFRDNNVAFKPIAPLEIDNFCIGSYDVDVEPEAGYVEYQIVLKALCPDDPTVAIAPTYSAEIKIAGSDNPWQGVDMVSGVVDLLGLPNQEYQIRVLWENEWEESSYFTEFDANGNYTHETGDRAQVHSTQLEDGRIQIDIEQVFSQDVCDGLE